MWTSSNVVDPAGKILHTDIHTSSESEDQVDGRFFLNIIVTKSSTVLKLLSGEDESLLIGGNTFLVLDLCLDILDGV
jgi:hypothetical protein